MFVVTDQGDGYIWILPDGTDSGLSFEQVLSALDVAGETGPGRTRLAMPTWSRPTVSPDHLSSAVVLERRRSVPREGSSFLSVTIDWIVVMSNSEQAVTGILEVPGPLSQGLIIPDWGARTGCLAVKVFDPNADSGRIYLLDGSAGLRAEVTVGLAPGEVIDAAGAGWIILDRTAWVGEPAAEFVNIGDPEHPVQVKAGDPFPVLNGVELEPGLTVAQGIEMLRQRRSGAISAVP